MVTSYPWLTISAYLTLNVSSGSYALVCTSRCWPPHIMITATIMMMTIGRQLRLAVVAYDR